jgi:hypothetical protein
VQEAIVASKSLTDVPEQGHDVMQAASMRPVAAPAALSVHAAGGGLELPGREKCEADAPMIGMDPTRAHEPIPGERDQTTLTHREPGAMTGAFNGEDAPPNLASLMDARTVREHVREGGGDEAVRHFDQQRRKERR